MRDGTFVATVAESKTPFVLSFGEGTTTAVIEVHGVVGIGVARCNPIDQYNEDIGIQIATARAIKNLAEIVEKVWTQRAHTKEEIAARRLAKKLVKGKG